jgi:hypothetical protein
MFLVYGILSLDREAQTSIDSRSHLPKMSFFAQPLVDQAQFSEQILLNTRVMDRLREDAEEAQFMDTMLSDDLPALYVRYDDPENDSIMNGSDNDQEESEHLSGWTSTFDVDLDEGENMMS